MGNPQQRRGIFHNQFGNSFGGGFGGRCWNCGVGFGGWGNRWGWGNGWGYGGWGGGWGYGGWGFGGPWLGFGLWDPFWADPFWGWPTPGYGYSVYPDSGVYNYPDSGYYAPDDNSNPPPPQDNPSGQYDEGNTDGNWTTPNGPSPAIAPNSPNLTVPVLIYLKSGRVLTVRDYWMIDGDLHYILMSGVQRTINLESVDLPRTNTENAKSGVRFIFKSEPSVTAPEPDGESAPPAQPEAQPGNPNTPAPTEQINSPAQPEAHT